MNIVFSCDQRMLAGLHVAAKSVLSNLGTTAGPPVFWVFSDDIEEKDIELLHSTLSSTGCQFDLRLGAVDAAPLQAFPRLTGSLAVYYRLLVPEQIDAERYLYLDVDILCGTDLSPSLGQILDSHPIALCLEGPLASSADKSVVELLGDGVGGKYFNAGVMLVDRSRWLEKNVTARCLDFLANNRADYCDQSAINYVLHGDIADLPSQYNCYANGRANWPDLRPPLEHCGQLLHFVDYPKPWSRYGRWVHPFGRDWWNAYRATAHYGVGPSPDMEVPLKWEQWPGYKKAIKDKLLFSAYSRGLVRPKGVPIS